MLRPKRTHKLLKIHTHTNTELNDANHPADEMLADKETSRINQAELSQPLSTAIQVALVQLLEQYGVRPDMVVGHSSGEIAAAYSCGSISADDAIAVAYYRGKVMLEEAGNTKTTAGRMAAIGLGPNQVQPYLADGVSIGCENSPESTTITGDQDAVEQAMQRIKDANPDVFVRALRVDRAYHSRMYLSISFLLSHTTSNMTHWALLCLGLCKPYSIILRMYTEPSALRSHAGAGITISTPHARRQHPKGPAGTVLLQRDLPKDIPWFRVEHAVLG